MAAFAGNPVCTTHPVKLIAFEIDGGSGTPVVHTNGNRLASLAASSAVADTGTGVITVTLREDFSDIWITGCNVGLAAGNYLATAIPDVSTSPPTIAIYIYDVDATAALDDTAGIISVTALGFMNSGGT